MTHVPPIITFVVVDRGMRHKGVSFGITMIEAVQLVNIGTSWDEATSNIVPIALAIIEFYLSEKSIS